MYIPIKVDYGVRALVDLALNSTGAPVRASDIAVRTVIPEQYLAQVLHSLSKGGFTHSRRGPQGGHLLAMHPSDIRLSAVMKSLGGTEAPVACLDEDTACVHLQCCAQREVWRSVAESVFNILDSTTIEDLVNRTLAARQRLRIYEQTDDSTLSVNMKTAV